MKKLIFISVILFISSKTFCQNWSVDFGDSLYINNGSAFTNWKLQTFKNKLYVGGAFNRVGNKWAYGIASWSGILWDSLGYGLRNQSGYGVAEAIGFYNNNIFAGGSFWEIGADSNGYGLIPNTKYIAGWNGANWFALSNIYPNNSVNSMCDYKNNLYIGGYFNKIGTTWYGKIARWDGSYHTVGGGITLNGTSYVGAMVVFNNKLITAGYFADNILAWDETQWQPLGSGLSGYVRCLYVDTASNQLYAGGWCFIPGDTLSMGGSLVKWNGTNWDLVGGWLNTEIQTITKYRGSIYIGGGFETVEGKLIKYLARWNGQEWDSVPGSPKGYSTVLSMTVFNDELIIGGSIDSLNGQRSHGLARYYEPPDSACLYFVPTIYTDVDTFYLQNDTVSVAFYNNNSHANSWQWNFGDTGTDTVWCPAHVYTQPGTYTINVNVTELWCNKSAQKTVVVLDTITSIADLRLTNADLRIFPNPASENVTIEISGALISPLGVRGNEGKNNELRITDQHGKTVKTFQLKESNCKVEINTKGWAKGAYLCSLVSEGKTVKVEKLVIE